jgi:hypothetical protein
MNWETIMNDQPILPHQTDSQELVELDNIRDVRLSEQMCFLKERLIESKKLKAILKHNRLKNNIKKRSLNTKGKILLFETNPEYLEAIGNLLSDLGYHVDMILDWDDFEDREDITYKAVFIHAGYTRWNAIGCLDELPCSAKTKIYVILLEEECTVGNKEFFLGEGASGILGFPVNNDELHEILGNLHD